MIKCGIIGFGYMGQIRRTVIEQHNELKLVGVCDTNPAIRKQISGYPVFASPDELLNQDVDAIFVCTPNCYSPAIAVQSLRSGRHVFCEKPPGRSVEDVKHIISAEKGSVKLMFGFNHRFHPGIIKAKVLIDSGRFGKIVALRGIYGKSGGIHFTQSWRNNKTISGGGILLDQGIHMMDLFRYFCGDFEAVKCFLSNTYWKFELEDNACVILQNKTRQTAMLHSSATLWKHTFKLDIILEEGYLTVEGLLSKTGSYGREKLIVSRRQFEDETTALGNPSEEVTYFDRDLSWDLEVGEFVKCILENKKVAVNSSEDALKVMQLIERAYRDAEIDQLAGEINEEHCRLR